MVIDEEIETRFAELRALITEVGDTAIRHGYQHGLEGNDPVGVQVQVKTSAGAPTHQASEATMVWVSPSNDMYVNTDGSTSWVRIATGGAGAPTGAEYLVKTANAELTAEEVVGTAPGGELGGTWASPTVDSTHSGTPHHVAYTDANARAAQKYVLYVPMGTDRVGQVHTP